MNGRVAQNNKNLKFSRWDSLTGTILDLLFLERNLRLIRIRSQYFLKFNIPLLTKTVRKDIKLAIRDNEETDNELIKRFKHISMEEVNL